MADRLPERGPRALRENAPGDHGLRERGPVLEVLREAVRAAAAGTGAAALVTGEAGIGKTSVVRALRAGMDHGVRVLAGACDDLLSPRALGPLREAVATTGRPARARWPPRSRATSRTPCRARPSPSSPHGGRPC